MARPFTMRAARHMVWIRLRSERRKPSSSDSRMAPRDTPGQHQPIDHFAHRLADAARVNAVCGIELQLLDAPSLGLVDGTPHGVGDPVGIQNGAPIQIAGGAAHGLDQAALRTQKALFVGIQNGHKRYLGYIQALAQQVDAHQHIEYAQAQVTYDFHPTYCVDVRMPVQPLPPPSLPDVVK